MEDTEPLNEPRTEANMNIATPQPGIFVLNKFSKYTDYIFFKT